MLKLSIKEIMDLGFCPTCLNRKYNGRIYGDNTDKLLYEDQDIEVFFVGNPRAKGHTCISSKTHYQDMSEAPDDLNEKIIRFAKVLMNILKSVFGCDRVYLCSMCDGKINHYHVQLIPRYADEEIGSKNFVKPRSNYVLDRDKLETTRRLLSDYAKKDNNK